MVMTVDERNAIKQAVLEAIKAESSNVAELEVVATLEGLTSLPAMMGEQLVSAPIPLLSKPASEAAVTANAAASTANKAAQSAETAAQNATNAAGVANTAASKANEAAGAANSAASKLNSLEGRIDRAEDGATARFDGFVDGVSPQFSSTMAAEGIYFDRVHKRFFAKDRGSGQYVNGWPSVGLYAKENGDALRDKIYLLGAVPYSWDKAAGTLKPVHTHCVLSETAYEGLKEKNPDLIYLIYEEE